MLGLGLLDSFMECPVLFVFGASTVALVSLGVSKEPLVVRALSECLCQLLGCLWCRLFPPRLEASRVLVRNGS